MSNWHILSAFTCPHVSMFPFPKAASNDQDDPSVLPGTTAFGLGCPQKKTWLVLAICISGPSPSVKTFPSWFWESWDSATELFHDFVQMFPAMDLLKWGQLPCPTLGQKNINNIITTTITIIITITTTITIIITIIIIITINIIFFPKRFTRMTLFTLPFKISDLFSYPYVCSVIFFSSWWFQPIWKIRSSNVDHLRSENVQQIFQNQPPKWKK